MRVVGKLAGFGVTLGILATVVFLPPVVTAKSLELHMIDEGGRDTPCSPAFAHVATPDRTTIHARALIDDLGYAASESGPIGCGIVLAMIAGLMALAGCLTRGLRCALRRFLVTLALGVPIVLCAIYVSCFLEGRSIRLGPDALDWVPASLHTQTHRTTGLLSPQQLVDWHYQRGFRVLNVSDRDETQGAREARAYAATRDFHPSLLVVVGEEWHGRPDIVLVNIKRDYVPKDPAMPELLAQVQREGGASFLAHPWAKLPGSIDDSLLDELHGVEVVNGVIHGGMRVFDAARERGKALLGTIDYKFGPHVNAMTLMPAVAARSPAGVVKAIRSRHTRVLYAVPGGVVTGEVWKAQRLGLTSAQACLRSLFVAPRGRRVVWFLWLAFAAALWRISTWRDVAPPERKRGAQFLFLAGIATQFAIPAFLGWQVRAKVGPIPVPVLLCAAAVAAVPILASAHVLSRFERSET